MVFVCVIPQFNSSLNTIPMIFFRFVAIQSDLGQEIKHLGIDTQKTDSNPL
jgi:hypothetical protein